MTTASAAPTATIAVIAGSGFFHLLGNAEDVTVTTPYGQPSDMISAGTVSSGIRTWFFSPPPIPPRRIP